MTTSKEMPEPGSLHPVVSWLRGNMQSVRCSFASTLFVLGGFILIGGLLGFGKERPHVHWCETWLFYWTLGFVMHPIWDKPANDKISGAQTTEKP